MKQDVVILGGGFAGVQAAKVLGGSAESVVLIDRGGVSTMLPLLPDLAGGWAPDASAVWRIEPRLPKPVERLRAEVSQIDLDAKRVVAGGESIEFDYLLIAAGSVPNMSRMTFPPERVYALGTADDARRIRENFLRYLEKEPEPHILSSGTGYTGLELATNLLYRAKALGRACKLTIVDPNPILLPSLPEKQRQYVLDFLMGSGAEVRLGAAVESYDGSVAVAGGVEYRNPFFVWAVGSRFPIEDVRGEVEQIRDGRFRVNADLSLPGYPDVFVAGDSAAVEQDGAVLRKAVNFAFYGGRHAGKNIARRLRGRSTRAFRAVDLGWIVPFRVTSVGRLPGGVWLRGGLGVRIHFLMCGLRNFSWTNFASCFRLALNPQGEIKMSKKRLCVANDGDANIGLLILRVFIGGGMLFAHGWKKLFVSGGLDYFTGVVASMNVPLPKLMALLSACTETFMALFLLVGLFTRPAALLLVINLTVAILAAHRTQGFAGQEMAWLYLVPSLFFVLKGAGKWSLDRILFSKR